MQLHAPREKRLAINPPIAPEANMKSYIGWWYATGPADQEFSPSNPAFNIHTVISDTSDVKSAVTVENAGGQRFPLELSLVERIALPPQSSPGGHHDV